MARPPVLLLAPTDLAEIECGICLSSGSGELFQHQECGHAFHHTCGEDWMARRRDGEFITEGEARPIRQGEGNCPLCRAITTPQGMQPVIVAGRFEPTDDETTGQWLSEVWC